MGNFIDKFSSQYLLSDSDDTRERSVSNLFRTPKYRRMPDLDPRSPTLEIERTPFYLVKYDDTPVKAVDSDDTPRRLQEIKVQPKTIVADNVVESVKVKIAEDPANQVCSPQFRPKSDLPPIQKRHLFASPQYKMSPNSPKERTPLGFVSGNEAAHRRMWKAPMDERKRLYGENTPPSIQIPFSSPRSAPPSNRL